MAREQSPASPLISPPRPTAPYPLPPHSPSHSPPGVAAIPAIPVIPPAPPPAPSDAPPAPDAPPALSHAPDAPAAPAARYDSDDDEDSDVDDRHPLLDEHSVPRRPQAASPGPSGSGRSYPPLRCPTRRYYPSYPVAPPVPAQCRGRPHGFRIPDSLKPWLGIGSWAVTSIGFLLAIAFWKKEVFTGLDRLSLHLQSLGYLGYAILFCLIFITTIPPFPLYSTLIILSGYTFGVWTGAVISYAAALSGAIVVFLLSRHYLRDSLSRLLTHATALKRVVRAIEKRPKLLLLIRIAPYPYNLMNVLLASSHTLTFSTYATCTALSLIKVLVHTSVGSSIHSFAGYHAAVPGNTAQEDQHASGLGRAWTVIGILLCFAILVYLSFVARRAVDDELGEDEGVARAEMGRGGLAEMSQVGT